MTASAQLLVVAIGACAYLGVFGLWSSGGRGPSRWVGLWAMLAAALALARLAQLFAVDAASATLAARAYCACVPLLLWSLARLVGRLCAPRDRLARGWALVALATSALALGTPWFVRGPARPALDVLGTPYLGVPAGPAMPLLGLAMAAALVWAIRTLRGAELPRSERRWLIATLTGYAALGATTFASSLGWIPFGGVAELAPFFVALALSHVLTSRRQRLEDELRRGVALKSQQLAESERRYREVVENMPIGLLSVDAAGQLEEANAKLLALLGSDYSQFASSFDVLGDESARRSGFAPTLARALQTGESCSGEFEFDTWWGRRLATRVRVVPRRSANGAVSGALAVIEDITEQRAVERRLQQTQRAEAVGQLAAGIAHEINNPMAYVRANLSMLLEETRALAKSFAAEDPAAPTLARLREVQERLESSLENVNRTVEIVRDLREFSHASAAQREPTDVNVTLENAARLAATRADQGREVELELGELPRVNVAPGQLGQVLLTLLIQALQAAGSDGHVRATTTVAGSEAWVRVRDDGPPIPPEDRKHLFEPLARVRSGNGTLGLYVARQIVEEHGGRIEVLSSGGHGTDFIVRLPIASEVAE